MPTCGMTGSHSCLFDFVSSMYAQDDYMTTRSHCLFTYLYDSDDSKDAKCGTHHRTPIITHSARLA